MTGSRAGLRAVLLLVAGFAGTAGGEPLTVAVASNFALPAEALADRFTAETGHAVTLSTSSTGKLYAQIVNGAPFDLFLAADSRRPQLLEASGLAVPGTRFTYAVGALVVWSRDPSLAAGDCRRALEDPGFGRVAIANPELAPYGAAARQFLEAAGLWVQVQPRLVYGENIAQALHFVATGNAALGLVARSQAVDTRLPVASCSWPVPGDLHDPISQDAVVLRRAARNPAAAAFAAFLRGPAAAIIIRRFGYETGS